MNVVFLLLDAATLILVIIPLFIPACRALGIDLVHFGVVALVKRMIGLITPPYGIVLFVINAVTGIPLRSIIRDDLAVHGRPHRGFAGVNVTYSYKVAILDHLDDLSDEARALGAVNTVIFRKEGRLGFNTDFAGFSRSFANEMADVARGRVLQLGAGGAGFAVGFGLAENGVGKLVIHDPDHARAAALAAAISAHYGPGRASVAISLEEAGEH